MKPNDINIAPVKKYTPPKYPTITSAKNDPDLLLKLPSRWEKNATVVVAIGLIGTMTLTSCGLLEPKFKVYNPTSENYLNVAPVFIHGEGTGYMGCMMVAPPVFLSEQEALAVIKSAAKTGGLEFIAIPPEYIATSNKKIYDKKYSWEKYPDNELLGNGNIGLDFYDDRTNVAVSYISMEKAQLNTDPSRLRSIEEVVESMPMSWSSRPRELAEMTAEDFSQQRGDISIGVFYEPGWYGSEESQQIIADYHAKRSEIWEAYYDEEKHHTGDEEYYAELEKRLNDAEVEYNAIMKSFIEVQLREQVQDFIEWLQGQGII
jgi:hypothetical protein